MSSSVGVACPVVLLGVSYVDLPDWQLSVRASREAGPRPRKLETAEAVGWLMEEEFPDRWPAMSIMMGVAYSAPEAGSGSA